MNKKDEKKILKGYVKLRGKKYFITKTIEEMAELTQNLAKGINNPKDLQDPNLQAEMAQVKLFIQILEDQVFNSPLEEQARKRERKDKLTLFNQRIKEAQK